MKVHKLPSNAHEFSKIWKNLLKTTADRYNFLLTVGSQRLGQIFHGEISFGLLGEMISVLSSNYSADDGTQLVAMLQALSTANRFNLSLQFLDDSERRACSQLLQQLHETFVSDVDEASQQAVDAVNSLMTVYSV